MQAWSTVRGKGKLIPSGGTLVIGREQDCPGGCFDSLPGAAGQTQRRYQLQGQTPLLFALVKPAGCQVKISTLGRSGAQRVLLMPRGFTTFLHKPASLNSIWHLDVGNTYAQISAACWVPKLMPEHHAGMSCLNIICQNRPCISFCSGMSRSTAPRTSLASWMRFASGAPCVARHRSNRFAYQAVAMALSRIWGLGVGGGPCFWQGVGRVVTCRVEEHASKGVGRVVTCPVEEHASKGVGRVVTCRVEEHSSKGVGGLLHVG